jgi:hypothetical protein
VTAFEVAEDEAATGSGIPGGLAGRLTFSVDRYLKGSGDASMTAVDRASLFREPGRFERIACWCLRSVAALTTAEFRAGSNEPKR